MYKSIFRPAAQVLLGVVALSSGITFLTPQAGAQAPAARRLVLSTGAQQGASKVLGVLPPYAQRLWWNSLQALEPGRAEAYLALQNAKPLGGLQAEARICMSALQMLPVQYHQKFMNGVVGVTSEDEQFAIQVLRFRVRQNEDASRVFAEGQKERERQGENYACALGASSCWMIWSYPRFR